MAFNKYPYTDFHEMNDDWVIGKVKELIAAWAETKSDWQQVQSDWETQQQAFDDLKSFVDTYFDNLDVQNEINAKLDAMAADGSLGTLMQPYIDSAVGDSIPATVSAWLSEHIDPDTGYVIDDTLSVSGAAADAKVVGDKITDLRDDVDIHSAQIGDVVNALECPVKYGNTGVAGTGYYTTIIDKMTLIGGVVYDVTVTLASALAQDGYLLLYNDESVVTSTTCTAGSTTATFYVTISSTGGLYNVKFATAAYASLSASATVVPRTHGSLLDQLPAIQTKLKSDSILVNNISEKRYISANMFDGNYISDKYVNKSGEIGNSASYGYTENMIAVNAGDVITISDTSAIRTMRFVCAYGADYEPITASGAESVDSYTVPSGVKYIRISAAIGYFTGGYFTVQNSGVMLPYDTYSAKDVPIDSRTYHDTHFITSSNIFDGDYVQYKGIKNDGTLFSDNNYTYTEHFIPVDAGDHVVLTNNNGIRFMRYVCAYDENYHPLADKGISGGTYTYYTVPSGVYYVRITGQTSVMTSNDVAIYRSRGVVFGEPDAFTEIYTNNRTETRLSKQPLTLMPDYMTKTLSYRPLGKLNKGYICMITDDGTEGLATYTIPLAISESIPMTFAVMKESEVFQDATMTATVVDAVTNHNCELAQHGGTLWDLMSEIDLNNFFDDQKAYFDTLNVELHGAVIPQHRTNDLVKSVAGARFGVVRSGYSGVGEDNNENGSIQNFYFNYTSGDRSNLYGLSSYNCSYATTSYNHDAVDYVAEHGGIVIVYFHEFDTYAEQQAVVEDLIAYAKTANLEFITLGQIPSLETWSPQS